MKIQILKTFSLAGVVSLISWGFLHIEPEHQRIHQAIENNLTELNVLETWIDKDFLKTQLRLTAINYDEINFHLHSARAQQAALLNVVNELKNNDLAQTVNAYLVLAKLKEKNLEKLKSETAVLSNSLHYLRNDYVPFLQDSTLGKDLTDTLGQLFNNLVLYYLNPENDELKNKILAITQALAGNKTNQTQEHIDFIDKILKHSTIVLENTTLLDGIVNNLNELDTVNALKNIEQANQTMLEAETHIANQYRILLGITTFILLAGIVVAVRRNDNSAFLLRESLRELKRQQYALDQHAIVSITDKAGRIIYANEKFVSISGYSLDELLQKDHRILNSGYHDREFFVDMWQTISQGQVWEANICNRSKSGELYWVQSTIVPFLDAENQVDHYISIRTDVTVQKDMEHAAIKSEEWQRTILNNLADGIYILDTQGLTTYFNSTAEKLLDFHFSEVKNKFLHDIIHHHKSDGSELLFHQCPISLSMQKQKVYQSDDEMFFRKNGDGFPVSVSCAPLFDNGEIVGSVVCFRDISEQRAIQSEMIRAKEAAENAMHVKSDFLSTMSHEIRTPMNGVLGMTELLLGTSLMPTQQKYVEAIYNSADSLLCIINDILDFSKIEASKLELEKIDFDLLDLIDQTVSFFQECAKKKNITLEFEVDENVPNDVCGDPNRLRQILTNLISNAIKFTHEGEIHLKIHLDLQRERAAFENEFNVCFCVHDTGIGISSEALPRLFQSFSQADSSTTRKYGGTGLGLTISKNLAMLMGGDIEVKSTVGEGSEFCLKICLQVAQNTIPALPTSSALFGKQALIICKNATNAKIIQRHTLDFGMVTNVMCDDSNVLEFLDDSAKKGQLFDIAFWDIKNCNEINAALIHHIRDDVRFSNMRIVILSLSSNEEDLQQLPKNICDLYLFKSVQRKAMHDGLLSIFSAPKKSDSKAITTGLNVLVAEDNVVNQEVIKAALKKLGCRVYIANNGAEAYELWQYGGINLILMDCMMPDVDGYQSTQRIRNEEAKRNLARIHIIALTANAMNGDKERCLAAGMDDYLSKPFQIEVLREKLENLVKSNVVTLPAFLSTENIIDNEPLKMLQEMGGVELVNKVLQLFFENTAILIQELKSAALTKNIESIRHFSHSIKSSAANVGAEKLFEMARLIEHSAREGEPATMAKIDDLEQIYVEAVRILAELNFN